MDRLVTLDRGGGQGINPLLLLSLTASISQLNFETNRTHIWPPTAVSSIIFVLYSGKLHGHFVPPHHAHRHVQTDSSQKDGIKALLTYPALRTKNNGKAQYITAQYYCCTLRS